MVAERGRRRHRGPPRADPEAADRPQGHPRSPTANRLLLKAAGRAPGWMVLLVVAAVAGAVTSLLVPDALGAAVDVALQGEQSGSALGRLGVLLAVGMAAEMLASVAGTSYGAATVAWLRHGLLRHVLRLGMGNRGRFAAGDLMTRLVGDAPGSAQVLPALLDAAITVVTGVGAVVALWLIDWRLAVTILIGLPLTAVIVRLFLREASELLVDYRRLQAAVATRFVDALAGIRTIRASGTADREVERVLAPLPALSTTGRALWLAQRQLTWQVGLLVPLLQVAVLAVAGFAVTAGRITPGDLLAAIGYFAIALETFNQIDSLLETAGAKATATRIAEVLAERPASSGDRRLPSRPTAVAFRGVTVRADETIVLDQLDLDVPAGVSVAIVGRSGAGKTTLVSLIGRLTDPDEGEVLLGGIPVSALDAEHLHRSVAYAFGRPALLGETIHGAIAYGRPYASRAEVERAARAAQADTFVRRLPSGYDTPLLQTPMSGGEAQRLGLARAIAQDSQVLVLDDATSSLDTATEAQVEAALATLLTDRTAVVVAHRATTAARADLVAWLDRGRVRAVAPHALLWDDPDYRAVFAAAPALVEAGMHDGSEA